MTFLCLIPIFVYLPVGQCNAHAPYTGDLYSCHMPFVKKHAGWNFRVSWRLTAIMSVCEKRVSCWSGAPMTADRCSRGCSEKSSRMIVDCLVKYEAPRLLFSLQQKVFKFALPVQSGPTLFHPSRHRRPPLLPLLLYLGSVGTG